MILGNHFLDLKLIYFKDRYNYEKVNEYDRLYTLRFGIYNDGFRTASGILRENKTRFKVNETTFYFALLFWHRP